MENQARLHGVDECRIDVAVSKFPAKNCVEGKVKDARGKPISMVCVKILSNCYEPITHTITDSDGHFVLVFPSQQDCILVFSKQGYTTKTLNSFPQFIEVVLQKKDQTSIITGKVYSYDCKPLSSIRLTLNSVERTKVAYTLENGEFTFLMIPAGEYVLTIEGNNCKKKKLCVKVCEKVPSINLGIIFVELVDTLCTIHGIVTDKEKQPINNATVVLYNAYNKQPIAYTVTNEEGLYFFGNVYRGCYYVQAFE